MERITFLQKKLHAADKTCTQFRLVLKKLNDEHYQDVYTELRDSAIQRFEFTLDTLWKATKEYLVQEYNITINPATPRKTFQEAANLGLINKKDLALFNHMVQDRNLTSHTYHQTLAEEIAKSLPLYYITMKKLLETIS